MSISAISVNNFGGLVKTKTAAIVTINDSSKMAKKDRKRIAKWLRSRADWFEKHGDLASDRFVQRYIYS